MPPYLVSIAEVADFLCRFHERRQHSGLVFIEREKNLQTLLDLEISPEQREAIFMQLSPADYCKGPKPDTVQQGSEYWEFGTWHKGRELYLKLSLGATADSPAICLSFHPAERTMRYTYKSVSSFSHA
jgi:hypothetical protein